MALASALLEAKNKLKKSEQPPVEKKPVTDGNAGDFLGFLKDEDELKRIREVTGIHTEEARVQYYLHAGVEAWFDELKENLEKKGGDGVGIDSVTFPTSVVNFTLEEKKSLYTLLKEVFDDGQHCIGTVLLEKVEKVKRILEGGDELGWTFDWKPLVERLDREIKEQHRGSAFIKLSTRSPKDSFAAVAAARSAEGKRDLYDEALDHNRLWVDFSENLRLAQCATTGMDALLLLATSIRVKEDLESDIVESSSNAIQIIVRGFDRSITPQTEFRGFVWGGRFTVLFQYFHQLHFPELHSVKAEVERDLRAFYDGLIRPNIPEFIRGKCPCFMMDLVWIPSDSVSSSRVVLTEINPFDGEAIGTFPASTGLFRWDYEWDRRSIMGEADERTGGFEFRLRDEPLMTAQNLRSHPSLRNLSPLWKWAIYGTE